jgi:hypothetical protein
MPETTMMCHTCFGTGEVATEAGVASCPDCHGDGESPSMGRKLEWRLLELESAYRTGSRESFGDVMWLVHELRRTREALVAILTRCQDADEADEVAKYVRAQAMAALGLYARAALAARPAQEPT